MKMYCCGVMYNTDDPETYWCVKKDIIEKNIKQAVRDSRVALEVVYTLICKKNGCTKVEIHRYGTADEQHLLEREMLSGKKAFGFLKSTVDIRKPQSQKFPYKLIPSSRRIPYVYGKAIDAYNQRARYLNEEGWASGGIIHSPIKTYKI